MHVFSSSFECTQKWVRARIMHIKCLCVLWSVKLCYSIVRRIYTYVFVCVCARAIGHGASATIPCSVPCSRRVHACEIFLAHFHNVFTGSLNLSLSLCLCNPLTQSLTVFQTSIQFAPFYISLITWRRFVIVNYWNGASNFITKLLLLNNFSPSKLINTNPSSK